MRLDFPNLFDWSFHLQEAGRDSGIRW